MEKHLPRTALYFTTVLALPDSSVIVGGHLVAEEDDPSATLVLRFSSDSWHLISKVDDIVYSLATSPTLDSRGINLAL